MYVYLTKEINVVFLFQVNTHFEFMVRFWVLVSILRNAKKVNIIGIVWPTKLSKYSTKRKLNTTLKIIFDF